MVEYSTRSLGNSRIFLLKFSGVFAKNVGSFVMLVVAGARSSNSGTRH
jgi:hypothetical protein